MKKGPHEKGFTIPVKKRIEAGRYRKAWAKSLEPNSNNQIAVCYDSGRRSTWNAESTIHEPAGFEIIEQPNNQES